MTYGYYWPSSWRMCARVFILDTFTMVQQFRKMMIVYLCSSVVRNGPSDVAVHSFLALEEFALEILSCNLQAPIVAITNSFEGG